MTATSWRGFGGEEKMTKEDWEKRAGDQARAMHAGLSWEDSSPDEDGTPTGGCYNGDYTQAQHDRANAKLMEDEYYEAQVEKDVTLLFKSTQKVHKK